MKIWRQWLLRGPNVWAAVPVFEVGLQLGSGAEVAAGPVVERLVSWLPALRVMRENTGPADSFASLAHVVERLLLHLQTLAGNPVQFSRTRAWDRPGCYRVAVAYEEAPVVRACLQTALAACQAAAAGQPYALAEEWLRLRDLADGERLGASARAVYQAAQARGLPIERLSPDDGRYVQLGLGVRQRRAFASEPDDISAVSRLITSDKDTTKRLLRSVGVPVALGRPVRDVEDAWATACELGLPVALKPQDCDVGQGVSLDLRSREQVERAYQKAWEKSESILVEKFAPGIEHRVIVIGYRVIAVSRIDPPHVIGDGRSSIAQLMEVVNRDPRRGPDYHTPLRWLYVDDIAREVLAGQGCTVDSVPPAGQRVLLRRNPPYLKNGGYLTDVTDITHPRILKQAVAAAEALKLSVVGLDVVAEDITRPLEEQGGIVVELNTGPGLFLHMAPWSVPPRPVGEAIVDHMIPPDQDGRIPVVALTGQPLDPAAGPALARLLAGPLTLPSPPRGRGEGEGGRCVGRTGRDGVWVAEEPIPLPRTTHYEKVRAVLQNPRVEAAVLEVSLEELLHEGLSCEHCTVAVVTGLAEPAEGANAETDGTVAERSEAWVAVLHSLLPGGKAVLPAELEVPADGPPITTDRSIRFAIEGADPRLRAHRAAGGTAVFLDGDAAVVARGEHEQRLRLGGRPRDEDRRALLVTVATGVALGRSIEELQTHLHRGAR